MYLETLRPLAHLSGIVRFTTQGPRSSRDRDTVKVGRFINCDARIRRSNEDGFPKEVLERLKGDVGIGHLDTQQLVSG